MPPVRHTDREYENELQSLKDKILVMGARVEDMIANATKALVERDADLATNVCEADHEINRLEVEIDEQCILILAKRQPVASDLRFLVATLKLVTDLERIGDLCVNIGDRVIELNEEPTLKPYVTIPRMADAVQKMVREALDAFVHGDAAVGRSILRQDRAVNDYYAEIFRELLTYMMENPRNIYRATRLQSIAKYLERMGDHAKNLGEMVVYMVKGKDIRHEHSRQ